MIEEEIELDKTLSALDELTGHNKEVFVKVLKMHMGKPNDVNVRDTLLDNLATAGTSVVVLLRGSNIVPSNQQLSDMIDLEGSLASYLDKFGYTGKVSEKARKVYLLLHNYLKGLRERELSESTDQTDGLYKKYYNYYLNENIRRVNGGLNPKDKLSDWSIETNSDLGKIKAIALEDSVKALRSGQDYSESRRDLGKSLGYVTLGEYADRKMLEGSMALLDRMAEKRIEKILYLEGLSEQSLSTGTWLDEAINKRIRERRRF